MEAHQTQEGSVGQLGAVTRQRYISVKLTENEAKDATVMNSFSGPRLMLFTTKRPEFFSAGVHLRFRNLMSEYGWRIVRVDSQVSGRAEIVCGEPEKIYGRRRLTAPEAAI